MAELNQEYIRAKQAEIEARIAAERAMEVAPKEVVQLDIDALDDFPQEKHRFHPAEGQRLQELEESIRSFGIINPLIVRPRGEGRWQIITGHNRRTAARNVGYTTVPCIVKRFEDDDDAIGVLTTDNLRNRELLPSERGWAYRDLLEISKRQGKRTDLTSSQFGTKLNTANSIGEIHGDSKNKVYRYIRLTYLIPELLKQVDQGKLGLGVSEQLSYLSENSQVLVYLYCIASEAPKKISEAQARAIREAEADPDQIIDEEFLEELLAPKKKIRFRTLKLEMAQLRAYFPVGTPEGIVVQTIHSALEAYFKEKE